VNSIGRTIAIGLLLLVCGVVLAQDDLQAQIEQALVKGDWKALAELAKQWAEKFGPDPWDAALRAASEASEAVRRGDTETAERAGAEARKFAERVPEMPDGWMIATFLQMHAAYMLGDLAAARRPRERLELIKDLKGERLNAIVEWLKLIARRHPRSPEVLYTLGIAQHWAGRYGDAIISFTRAIKLRPDFAQAYVGRGAAYVDKGHYDRAIRDYTKAIQLSPHLAKAYDSRGVAYYHKGDYERAIADHQKAIELDPRSARYYANLAHDCVEAIEKYPGSRERYRKIAIEALRKFIELAPEQGVGDLVTWDWVYDKLRELGAE